MLFLVSWLICGASVAIVDYLTYLIGWNSPYNAYHPNCGHFFCKLLLQMSGFVITIILGYVSLYDSIREFIRSFFSKSQCDVTMSAMYPNMTQPFNNDIKDDKYGS